MPRLFGFVGEGGERESERERQGGRERKRGTTGDEPLPEAQRVVAGEGGACSLPEVGGAFDPPALVWYCVGVEAMSSESGTHKTVIWF